MQERPLWFRARQLLGLSDECAAAADGREATRWLFWQPARLPLGRQPRLAAACRATAAVTGVYVNRSGRAGGSGSLSGALWFFSPRACAKLQQGWRAAGSQLAGAATVTPSRCCPGSPARSAPGVVAWKTREVEPPGRERDRNSGRHRCRPLAGKVLAAGNQLLVPPDTLSNRGNGDPYRVYGPYLGAAGGKTAGRRGPPPHLHPNPGAQRLQDLDAAASQALESEACPRSPAKGA